MSNYKTISKEAAISLLEFSPVCTKIIDLDFNLQYMSCAGVKALKIKDITEFYGKPYPFSFFPDSFKNKMLSNLKKVKRTGEVIKQEAYASDTEGKGIWFQSTLVPLNSDGKIDCIMVVSSEITELKQNETRLQEASDKLIHSNQELEQFAYIASHDLQEPLRAISYFSQLLKQKDKINLDEESKKYQQYIIDSSERMSVLIRELLDYSRVGRSDNPFEKINIKDIIQDVLVDFEVSIKETEAEIIVEENCEEIFAISFRFKQFLHNLISNSLKFRSKEKPVIKIKVEEKSDQWLFSVKDNGIGIEEKYHDRIYGIFKRLYSREEYPGTGIGLALCKKIIEAHNGTMWVKSDFGKGTCVYFTIPKGWNTISD